MMAARLLLMIILVGLIASRIAGAQSPGDIFEASRKDVTVPLAEAEDLSEATTDAVQIPVASDPSPLDCMTAWSYLAARTIREPETALALHADFNEANASRHWQHWLKQDLNDHAGQISPDFHQRRLRSERSFNTALNDTGETHAYRLLGACHVAAEDMQLGDPTLLLRNFMVQHQGLPARFAVPDLQRQLRSFPVRETVEPGEPSQCAAEQDRMRIAALGAVRSTCFARGGLLASQPSLQLEASPEICRAIATVQCEKVS